MEVTLTPAEAAVLAWIELCEGYRLSMLIRRLSSAEERSRVEVEAFAAEHPTAKKALRKLRKCADAETMP